MATGDKKPVAMASELVAHTDDKGNPHVVTAAQTGAYSKGETDTLFSTLLSLLTKQTEFVDSFQGDETCDTAPMGIRKTMSTTGFPSNFGEWALIITYYYNAEKQYGWQIAYDMNGHQIAYRYRRNSSWFDWKYIATTDYAVNKAGDTMTGFLTVPHLISVSKGRIEDWEVGELDFKITDRNGGATRYISVLDETRVPNFNNSLNFVQEYNGSYNIQNILHTGNKPSGSYTGNGSATSRTINTGGIGNVAVIMSVRGVALVSKTGVIGALDGSAFTPLGASQCKIENGIITITSDNHLVNQSGTEYTYQVL